MLPIWVRPAPEATVLVVEAVISAGNSNVAACECPSPLTLRSRGRCIQQKKNASGQRLSLMEHFLHRILNVAQRLRTDHRR